MASSTRTIVSTAVRPESRPAVWAHTSMKNRSWVSLARMR
jgi:hypothetical protein